VEKNKTLS